MSNFQWKTYDPNAALLGPFTPPLSNPVRKPKPPVQNTSTSAHPAEPPRLHWNAQADSFALAAHRTGLAAPQISKQLCLHGYSVSKTEVADSLHRQGVQNVSWTSNEVPTLNWDIHAEAFALSGYRSGQTVSQITAQLCRNGYMATTANVVSSLSRQGFIVV